MARRAGHPTDTNLIPSRWPSAVFLVQIISPFALNASDSRRTMVPRGSIFAVRTITPFGERFRQTALAVTPEPSKVMLAITLMLTRGSERLSSSIKYAEFRLGTTKNPAG